MAVSLGDVARNFVNELVTDAVKSEPGLEDAALAVLNDYQVAFPDATSRETTRVLGYFATFIHDLVSISPEDLLFMDAETALIRLAASFAAAGLLAYKTEEN